MFPAHIGCICGYHADCQTIINARKILAYLCGKSFQRQNTALTQIVSLNQKPVFRQVTDCKQDAAATVVPRDGKLRRKTKQTI